MRRFRNSIPGAGQCLGRALSRCAAAAGSLQFVAHSCVDKSATGTLGLGTMIKLTYSMCYVNSNGAVTVELSRGWTDLWGKLSSLCQKT